MTQFLSGILAGGLVGGFVGFIAAGLIISSKASALAHQRKDEDETEAFIAEKIEPEVVKAARLSN